MKHQPIGKRNLLSIAKNISHKQIKMKVGDSIGKVIIIDEKMNSVQIELNETILKNIGVIAENVKKHKSRRQLNIEITEFLKTEN